MNDHVAIDLLIDMLIKAGMEEFTHIFNIRRGFVPF